MDAIAVELPGAQLGQIPMPDVIGALAQHNPLDLTPAVRVEQTEFDLAGVFREQGEVDAVAIPGGAKRLRVSG